jgi:radical SAM protein with 4Fe4S-binding SPASM domain
MRIEKIESLLAAIPGLNRLYWQRAGQLKRNLCLMLHRLGLLRPFTFVQWLATYGCNFRCPYCEASAGVPHPQELTTSEVRAFFDDLVGLGVKRLLISGGEPLTRPDILELMGYAHHRGLQLGLVSNGYLVEEMWSDLQHFRFFLFFTSLDRSAGAHDKVRGHPGAWNRVLGSLRLMQENGVPVRIVNTVVPPNSMEELPQLLPVVKQSGATHWRLSTITQVGRAAGAHNYGINGTQLRALVEFAHKANREFPTDLGCSHIYLKLLANIPFGKPSFCGAGLTRCSVLPTGEVLGCQLAYDTSLAEGNLREKPFSVMWREGFQRFRKPVLYESCNSCSQRDGCLGGCWAEMATQGACLKEAWEKDTVIS